MPKSEMRAPWIIRTYAGFGDAEQSNRRYRENLAQGQRGLSVAFDLPTQNGYDAEPYEGAWQDEEQGAQPVPR